MIWHTSDESNQFQTRKEIHTLWVGKSFIQFTHWVPSKPCELMVKGGYSINDKTK